jgi:hypothetical protein
MKILVPASVDVESLVARLNLTRTRSNNIKEKIYFFLSRVVTHNGNYHLYEKTNGYRLTSSVLMKKILGSKCYYEIIELLKNFSDPIIETNKSYYHPSDPELQGYCLGYRLTDKYNTGEVVHKTLPDKFKRNTSSDQDHAEVNTQYKFLLNQFDQHKITFDLMVYEYVRNFGNKLLCRINDNNPYQTQLVYNKIGRWLDQIEKIDQKIIWKQLSPDNHRLNSNITGLKKLIRPFLLCNDKPLHEIDLTASQPYILATIMKDWFFSSTNKGYNLKSIYPELYNKITTNNSIDYNLNYSNNRSINYNSSITGTSNNNYFINNSINSSTSFMWCKFFTTHEQENVKLYRNSPFFTDFYSHVLKLYYTEKKGFQKIDSLRDEFKRSMMFVLFEDNQNHRYNNRYINIFRSVYPGVDKWISVIHQAIGKKEFSYLLQRVESHLLLNTVCREFNQYYPQAPLFTIHDAILTHREYIPDLTGFVLSRLEEETGILGGVKTKPSQMNPEPRIDDLNNEWNKIKDVVNERAYEKNSCGVFSINIKKGSEFLKKNGKNFSKGTVVGI